MKNLIIPIIALTTLFTINNAHAEVTPEQTEKVEAIYQILLPALDKLNVNFYTSKTFPFKPEISDKHTTMACNFKTRKIYVPEAMLKGGFTDDEIAGMFAHEMGHVVANNCMPFIKTLYTDEMTKPNGQVLIQDREIQADLIGLELIYHTKHYDLKALVTVMNKIIKDEDLSKSQIAVFNKRVDYIERTISQIPKNNK